MQRVTIICVGKLKESYLRDACKEYEKRLGAYCRLQTIEVEEHRLPDRPSQAQIDAGIRAEGERILRQIPAGAVVIALCIEGQQVTSPQLAERLGQIAVQGGGDVVFVIGGSNGLYEPVKARSALRLSMSKMTFPHQLARVMLLEQIYRAYTIQAGARYHK